MATMRLAPIEPLIETRKHAPREKDRVQAANRDECSRGIGANAQQILIRNTMLLPLQSVRLFCEFKCCNNQRMVGALAADYCGIDGPEMLRMKDVVNSQS